MATQQVADIYFDDKTGLYLFHDQSLKDYVVKRDYGCWELYKSVVGGWRLIRREIGPGLLSGAATMRAVAREDRMKEITAAAKEVTDYYAALTE